MPHVFVSWKSSTDERTIGDGFLLTISGPYLFLNKVRVELIVTKLSDVRK